MGCVCYGEEKKKKKRKDVKTALMKFLDWDLKM